MALPETELGRELETLYHLAAVHGDRARNRQHAKTFGWLTHNEVRRELGFDSLPDHDIAFLKKQAD